MKAPSLNKEEIVNYIIDKAKSNIIPFLSIRFVSDPFCGEMYEFTINKKRYYADDIKAVVEDLTISELANLINQIEIFENNVMTPSNNHNPQLVEKINQCWLKKQADFQDILHLLAVRYYDELEHYFQHSVNLTTIGVSKALASDILTHICDDKDLECIISYCRI